MSAQQHTPAQEKPVVIAAGGTGGHLFPAQALAQELSRRGHRLVLVTDARGKTYTDAFPDADIQMVDAATFAGRGPLGKVMALGSIVSGIARAFFLLGRIKPSVVVGFGGYPSLPAMGAGILRGVPTCLHEQNAILGRVNRLLSRRVDVIASAFEGLGGVRAKDKPKISVTGNPVRDAIAKAAGAPYTAPEEGGEIRLLIIGGSQGARILSRVVPDALARLPETLRARLNLTQQCRPEDLDAVRALYAEHGIKADLAPFFDAMDRRIKDAHLVIARSGASTVTELAVIGRPAILVPFAAAMDDHQTVNARVLTDAGGAWPIAEADFTPENLGHRLETLLSTPHMLSAAALAARGQGKPEATRALADIVEGLAFRSQNNRRARAAVSAAGE